MADYRPNFLTAYLFELANRYSTFFEQCPVLKADSDALRAQPAAAVRSDGPHAPPRAGAVGHSTWSRRCKAARRRRLPGGARRRSLDASAVLSASTAVS